MATTRLKTDNNFSAIVGKGKEFIKSEVPTVRAVLQKGILIKEKALIEKGTDKYHCLSVADISRALVPEVIAQWQRANSKFSPPVIIQVKVFFFHLGMRKLFVRFSVQFFESQKLSTYYTLLQIFMHFI